MAMLNEKGRGLPAEFTLQQAFEVLVDGFVEPDMGDLRLLGAALARMGWRKRRAMEHGDRRVLWFFAPATPPPAKAKTSPRPRPRWADDLIAYADKQKQPFTLEEAIVLGTELGESPRIAVADMMRAAAVLREQGYTKSRVRRDGEQAMRWQRIDPDEL